MVRLTKVEIENYKLCKKTTLDLNDGLTALIGPNGSGKTTLLEAVDIVKHAVNNTYAHKINTDFLINTVKFYFKVNDYECTLLAKNYTTFSLLPLPFYNSNFYFNDIKNFETAELGAQYFINIKNIKAADIYFKLDTKNEKLSNAAIQIVRYLSSITYYNTNSFELPNELPILDYEYNGELIENDYRDTLRFLYNLQDYIKSNEIGLYKSILKKTKLVDDFQFISAPRPKPDEKYIFKNTTIPIFNINNNIVTINQLSQGTLRALALIFYIMYDKGSLLLIEEPESFIHKGLLDTILDLIIRESKNKQFIITTHSDYVLDRLQPENIVLVENDPKKGIVANKLSKAMGANNFKALKAFLKDQGGLGEYWKTFDFEKK